MFNAIVAARLAGAPAGLAGQMPDEVNAVLAVLLAPATPEPARDWLRGTIAMATDRLYLGMTGFSILVFVLLFIVPRRLALRDAGTGPQPPAPDRAAG